MVLSLEQDAIIDPEGWNFTQLTELYIINIYIYIYIYKRKLLYILIINYIR